MVKKVAFVSLDKDKIKNDPDFIQGTPGRDGIQGPKGEKGDQGIQGLAGKDGKNGIVSGTQIDSIKVDVQKEINKQVKAEISDNLGVVNNNVAKNTHQIKNNTKRIGELDTKINKTTALTQATANLDFGNVKVGNTAIGLGVGNYNSETGVAVGIAYRPSENFFMSAKWSGLPGTGNYNSYGASATYQFNFK